MGKGKLKLSLFIYSMIIKVENSKESSLKIKISKCSVKFTNLLGHRFNIHKDQHIEIHIYIVVICKWSAFKLL